MKSPPLPIVSSPEDVHLRVGKALLAVLRNVEAAFDQAAGIDNIHTTDFRCIGYLKAIGTPVSPKHILAFLGLSSGAGTALFDRLEASGFIRRLPNPEDRRSVLIELDEDAAQAPLALYRQIHSQYRQAIGDFTEAELKIVAAYLEKVAALKPV